MKKSLSNIDKFYFFLDPLFFHPEIYTKSEKVDLLKHCRLQLKHLEILDSRSEKEIAEIKGYLRFLEKRYQLSAFS